MAKTKIEWCDQTINPVIGCSKCSPGCENCYAEKFAARLARNGKLGLRALDYQVAVENGEWSGKVVFDLKCFDKLPKRPATVFLASMGDVFHENVPFHHIAALWRKMAEYPQHRFLVLTKRAERMEELLGYLRQKWARTISENPRLELANVWLGVTVCNQAEADEKVAHLLATPAAGRFISVEPMLGPTDLWSPKFKTYGNPGLTGAITGWAGSGLEWVICGGETGGQAPPGVADRVTGCGVR